MSKMSNLMLEIQEMIADGYSPIEIAEKLRVPLQWVDDTIETIYDYDMEV